MTRESLKQLIDAKLSDNFTKLIDEEVLGKKLEKHSDENGRINNTSLAIFTMIESIKISKDIMYSVLAEVLPLDD